MLLSRSGCAAAGRHAALSYVGGYEGMWVLSVVLALQLAGCSGVALWSCVRAESWPSRLVKAFVTAVMLAMAAGAVAAI